MKTATSLVSVVSLILAAGCASAPDGEGDATVDESALQETASITFRPNSVDVSGKVQAGGRVRVSYDANRMPTCRGNIGNGPGWSVTGYYRIDDGPATSFAAAGLRPDGSTGPFTLTLPNTYAGRVEFWFQNTNRWGCQAWDSNNGRNFAYAIGRPSAAAQWAGLTKVMGSRETCNNGRPCDHAWQTLGAEPFVFDTWTRQRAAITQASFEVYKPGMTDRDNPNLWRDLDVRMYSRVGNKGAFKMAYVSVDERRGNNARYMVNTRTLDPFHMLNTPNRVEDCPSFPFVRTGGQGPSYVEATVEFYFTIGGVELRPDAGDAKSVYRGKFVEYDRFQVCPGT